MDIIERLYGARASSVCPFTQAEVDELKRTNEILIYLPAHINAQELCQLFGLSANVDFSNEKMIRCVMTQEDQWFIASTEKTPEFLYKTAHKALRVYEDEGLHGMDFRRYIAFVAFFKETFGFFPDQTYWTFLLSGSYDRSGVSILGFDTHGILSHHGWMKDFKAKFCGSRYIVLPPRIEITSQTAGLQRAYRGKKSPDGLEAVTSDEGKGIE